MNKRFRKRSKAGGRWSKWVPHQRTWSREHVYEIPSGLIVPHAPKNPRFDGDSIPELFPSDRYVQSGRSEEFLTMLKLALASNAPLPNWISTMLGQGSRLIIIDSAVGAGKTRLSDYLQNHAFGRTLVLDEPLHHFKSAIEVALLTPNRVSVTRAQCSVIRAWELEQPRILEAIRNDLRVVVMRGPQGFYLFDSNFISPYARRVFQERIRRMVGSWMEAQGLSASFCPSRIYLDLPGGLVEQVGLLQHRLSLRGQVGDAYYTEEGLRRQLQLLTSANQGLSAEARHVLVSRGLCVPFHVALYELTQWIEGPLKPSNSIWISTNLLIARPPAGLD